MQSEPPHIGLCLYSPSTYDSSTQVALSFVESDSLNEVRSASSFEHQLGLPRDPLTEGQSPLDRRKVYIRTQEVT